MPSALLPHALSAHAAGLAVIPPRQDGSKAPIAAWKDYQSAPPTEEQLRRWYQRPLTGIGLICGTVSGGLEMLEFEGRAVTDGFDQLFLDRCEAAGLSDVILRILDGYLETTPTGGLHLLWRSPHVDGNLKLARRSGAVPDTVDVLLETRGEGGYTIVAPSNGKVHPTGRDWVLARGGFDTIATITVDERAALLDVARSLDQMPRRPPPAPPRSDNGHDLGERPGDWYSANTTWPQILEPHGWRHIGHQGDEALWCRPGKNHGISATTNYADTDLLKVFSTSTPFDTDTAYTRFAAWTVLDHHGDYTAAARYARALMPDTRPTAQQRNDDRPPPPDDDQAPDDELQNDTPPPPPPRLHITPLTATFSTPPAQPPVLIDGLLRAGEMCAIAAPRAIGKSWLGMNLAYQLAQGTGQLAGHLTIRRSARVLYCHGELGPWGAYQRWYRMAGPEGPPTDISETFDRWRIRTISRRTTFRNPDGTSYSDEYPDAILDHRLEASLIDHGTEVLVIDPWAVYYAGKENSSDEVEAALDKLRDLTLRHGIAIIIFHHITAKPTYSKHAEPEDHWRGSTRLADWASTRVTILRHYTETETEQLQLTRQEARRYVDAYFLRRDEPTPDFNMKMNFTTGWWEPWDAPSRGADEGPDLDDIARRCANRNGWDSIRKAAADLDVSRRRAEELLDRAVIAGYLVETRGPRNSVAYMPTQPTLAGALIDHHDPDPEPF